MEFTSHSDQSYHTGYCPPPQNDSCHYLNGGWEYYQGMIDYEQSTQLEYAPGPQNDQDNFMGYYPPPQNDSFEDHLQESREFLERQEQSWKEQEILYKRVKGHLDQIAKNLGVVLIKEDEDQFVSVKEEWGKQDEEAPVSSKISMKNEVVEACEPRIPYPQRLLEGTK
ncbi:hypothetical protein AHAS_Ahas13G0298600 [Arachis hypogaea]